VHLLVTCCELLDHIHGTNNINVTFRQPVHCSFVIYVSNCVKYIFFFLKIAPINKNVFSPLLIKAVSYTLTLRLPD